MTFFAFCVSLWNNSHLLYVERAKKSIQLGHINNSLTENLNMPVFAFCLQCDLNIMGVTVIFKGVQFYGW